MTSSFPEHEPYLFPQPIGLWKRRGASEFMIELATGHLTRSNTPPQEELTPDQSGFGVWHYWAQSPHPEQHWRKLRNILSDDLDLHCSASGEHPLHRLVLKGNMRACALWSKEASFPPAACMGSDTYWHCLAWSGNAQLIGILADEFDIHQINDTDSLGMTAAMIATHRGGKEALKQLLLLGADPDIVDEHHKVILHHVAQYGDVSWFTEVQDLGAADDVKNDRGQTPLDVLRERTKHGTQTDLDILRSHWDRRYFQKIMF